MMFSRNDDFHQGYWIQRQGEQHHEHVFACIGSTNQDASLHTYTHMYDFQYNQRTQGCKQHIVHGAEQVRKECNNTSLDRIRPIGKCITKRRWEKVCTCHEFIWDMPAHRDRRCWSGDWVLNFDQQPTKRLIAHRHACRL